MTRVLAAALALLLCAAAPATQKPPPGQAAIRAAVLFQLRQWGIYSGAVIPLGDAMFAVEAIAVDFAGADPTVTVKFKRLQ